MIRSIASILMMILVTASAAIASERSYLSAGLGKTWPHKPEIAKQYVDNGNNASLGVGFDFTTWLSMHVTGEYHWGEVDKPYGTWFRETLKAKCAFLWLKLSPYTISSRVGPYVLMGVGYVYADRDKSAGATTYGIGADVWLTETIALFAEGRHVKADFDEGRVEGRLLRIGVVYLLRQ